MYAHVCCHEVYDQVNLLDYMFMCIVAMYKALFVAVSRLHVYSETSLDGHSQ